MKSYGLIGKSLKHSFSKEYFTKKFERDNLEARYENFEFESVESIRSYFEERKDVLGLNVTIPYKQSIIPFLDELDDSAKEIGAVNTIKISEGKWIGYNTDFYGFMTSLKPFLENTHDRVLVLGSGGASLAIQYSLKLMDIPFHVVSREKGKGDLTYEDLNEHVIKACKLIINTTPVGTFPDIEEAPSLPYENISSEHLVYDLVYNPDRSKFLALAEAQGAMVMNGLDMLKHQAEKAWRVWSLK